ncbi:MAG: cell division FtsA domain-containing protein [Prosthecobacter sp.]|nr:cell division FtsA domain-containing protein [Prosthecobacter sp.]
MSTHYSNLARRDFLRFCAAGIACPAVAKPPTKDIVVGLEFGVAKICAVVSERMPNGTIKVLGIGRSSSWGVTKYSIKEDESVNACVHAALMDAEAQSGVKIRSVVLAVAGMKIAPFPTGPSWEDILEWENSCYTNRSDGVMRRVTLAECKRMRDCQIVSGAGSQIEISRRCLKTLGIEVERLVFTSAASAAAVLSAHQRERGALVIDMGAGTTDYAAYAEGVLVHSDCIDSGGENILSDLAHDLHISGESAEKLLFEHATVRPGQPPSGERIMLKEEDELGVTYREVERDTLNDIVCYDVSRMFRFVRERLKASGVQLSMPLLPACISPAGAHCCPVLRGLRRRFSEFQPSERGCMEFSAAQPARWKLQNMPVPSASRSLPIQKHENRLH